MKEWSPREIKVGDEIPPEGDKDKYDERTPERALVETLYYWEIQNPGYLAEMFIDREGEKAEVSAVVEEFEGIDLESYRLKEVTDVAVAQSEITVELLIDRGNGPEWEENTVRMTFVKDNGESGIPGLDNGNWTVEDREVFLNEYLG